MASREISVPECFMFAAGFIAAAAHDVLLQRAVSVTPKNASSQLVSVCSQSPKILFTEHHVTHIAGGHQHPLMATA
jgi:hypothetical protein